VTPRDAAPELPASRSRRSSPRSSRKTSRGLSVSDGGIATWANPEGTSLTIAAGYGIGRIHERAWEGPLAIPLHRLRLRGRRAFARTRPVLLQVADENLELDIKPTGTRTRHTEIKKNKDISKKRETKNKQAKKDK